MKNLLISLSMSMVALVSSISAQQFGSINIKINTDAQITAFDQNNNNVGSVFIPRDTYKILEVNLGEEPTSITNRNIVQENLTLFKQGETFKLSLPNNIYENAEIKLVNINGEELLNTQLTMVNINNLSLNGVFSPGIYFVVINNKNNNPFIQKLHHTGGKLNILISVGGNYGKTPLCATRASGDTYLIKISPLDKLNYNDTAFYTTIFAGSNTSKNIVLSKNCPTLSAPSGLKVTNQTDRVTVSCNPVPVATSYVWSYSCVGNAASYSSITGNIASMIIWSGQKIQVTGSNSTSFYFTKSSDGQYDQDIGLTIDVQAISSCAVSQQSSIYWTYKVTYDKYNKILTKMVNVSGGGTYTPPK